MTDNIKLNIDKLIVKHNGKIVGYLKQLENNKIAFQYDSDWLKDGFSISPFSIPLKPGLFISKTETFDGLYGVFNDSLPDGWGQLLLIKFLAKQNIDPRKLSPLTKLSLISSNGLGGLSYFPSQSDSTRLESVNLDKIAFESKKILDETSSDVNLDQLFALGGSSGGARPKAHLNINNHHWIVKFPSSSDPKDIGKKEYEANQLAKKCGIDVPNCKLFKSTKCSGYFGSERFDWFGGNKIHAISLAGLLETSHHEYNIDYFHLFQVIQTICYDKQKDIYEAYKRMCFNVLFGNKDDHGKNWLFLYDEEKHGYKLSPFYDITKTDYLPNHALSLERKDNPSEQDLIRFAKNFKLSLSKCSKILSKIKHILKMSKSET